MAWPVESDYLEAVQNPQYCFADSELRTGSPTVTRLGLPKPITGAFASVYQMNCSGRSWAVRCFLREFADQQRRYTAISDHLRTANLPSMVGFEFLSEGIRLKGKWYPILKMEWIEGEPLNTYIARNLNQPGTLQSLARQWIDLMAALRRAKVAHGDLQHGNILVSDGSIRLIDYDGMYVPALAGLTSHEEGHRNYQHPSRSGRDFDANLDNFSAWVIFISISAVAVDPRLWRLVDAGDEHLLFRREDFQHPNTSKVFQALEQSGKPQLKLLGNHFRSLIYLQPTQLPALDGASAVNAPPSPSTGLPEWLSGHLAPERPPPSVPLEAIPDVEAPPPVGGASWLYDHLVDQKPLAHALQGGRYAVKRLTVAIAILVASALGLYAGLGRANPLTAATLALGVLVAEAAFLYVQYRTLDLFKQKRDLRGKRAGAEYAMRESEGKIERALAERKLLAQPLKALDAQYRALPQRQHEELLGLQQQLAVSLGRVAERRKGLDQGELRALEEAKRGRQNEMNQLLGRRSSLDQNESAELRLAVGALQQAHRTAVLSTAWLAGADISGIGPKLKARLNAAGINSAGDVVDWRVRGVDGIGEAKAASLFRWRVQVEQQALASMPQAISHGEEFIIRGKYIGQRQLLAAQIDSATRQEHQDRQSVLSRFAVARAALGSEEDMLKVAHDRDRDASHAKYVKEQERLTHAFRAEKARVVVAIKQSDAQLARLHHSLFQEQVALNQFDREISRYREVSFWRFVLRVLMLSRSD